MISKTAIVGCGTVGASLAIELAKKRLISDLKLYDFDCVSEFSEQEVYPFYAEESGISKVQIVKFQCRVLNPNLKVLAYQERIDKSIDNISFVIDCRDNKSGDIGAKVRISLDGHLLYVDSTKYKQADYHRYITPRNPNYVEKALLYVLDYLTEDKYIFNDFRLYDLEIDKLHILDKERGW